MSKQYFKFLFKENRKSLIVLLFFSVILGPVLTSLILNSKNYDGYFSVGVFFMYCFMIFVLAYIIPFINFKFIHSKKSVDTYFSLPIVRKDMFFSRFAFTLIEVIGIFLLNFLLILFVLMLKSITVNYLLYFAFMAVAGIMLTLIISINVFIIIKCNSVLDSLICMVIYSLFPIVISFALNFFIEQVAYGSDGNLVSVDLFSPLVHYFSSTFYLLEGAFNDYVTVSYSVYVIYLLAAVLFTYLGYNAFLNRKSEDAEQITTSRVMYKTILPLGLFTLLLFNNYYWSDLTIYLIGLIVIYLIYIVGVFIYTRKLKIGKTHVITMVLLAILVNSLYFVFKSNNGFGLSKIYPQNYQKAKISFNLYNDESDIYIEAVAKNNQFAGYIHNMQNNFVDIYDGKEDYSDTYCYIYYSYNGKYSTFRYNIKDKKTLINILNKNLKGADLKYSIDIYYDNDKYINEKNISINDVLYYLNNY